MSALIITERGKVRPTAHGSRIPVYVPQFAVGTKCVRLILSWQTRVPPAEGEGSHRNYIHRSLYRRIALSICRRGAMRCGEEKSRNFPDADGANTGSEAALD